eukprot:15366990-Ditylum_brightwellii.AAC.2
MLVLQKSSGHSILYQISEFDRSSEKLTKAGHFSKESFQRPYFPDWVSLFTPTYTGVEHG